MADYLYTRVRKIQMEHTYLVDVTPEMLANEDLFEDGDITRARPQFDQLVCDSSRPLGTVTSELDNDELSYNLREVNA